MDKVLPRNGSTFFGFGSSRHNRAPKSLDPNYVKLDDRTLPELLAYSAELSKYIHYFDKENKPNGTWEPFFYSDISVNIALIISIDLKSIDDEANSIVSDFYKFQDLTNKSESFLKLYSLCFNLATKFNVWYNSIVELNLDEKRFESQIEFELFNIINDKVKPHLFQLFSLREEGQKIKSLVKLDEFSFDQFSSIWDFKETTNSKTFTGKTDEEKVTSGMLALRLQFQFLFQALNFSVNHFKRYFYNSLKFKDTHNPDISLFIGFLQIFKNIQQDYNQITERLQAFYYQNILKIKPLLGTSDKAHIFFELADNVDRYVLPKGTLLTAGIFENGDDILFETEQDLEITQAKVAALKTIYSSRLDDLDTSNYKLTSHLYAAPIANSVDGFGKFQELKFSWPLFGEEQEYKSSEEANMGLANLGFAFSSPIFHMKEGNRKVTIKFDFLPESTRIYKRLVYDIYLKVNKDRKANEPAKVLQEIFYDRIFNQVDKERNFQIFLTGTKQWYEVQPNTITVKAVGNGDWVFDTEVPDEENMNILNSLEVEFTLPNSAPPITSFDVNIHPGNAFDTPDPVIQFLLNDKKQPLIYSFLQGLQIQKINVKLEVDRVRDIKVYDEYGVVYASKNIYPFGLEPQRGSQAYIGAPELFKKHLTEVKIQVEWDKIPQTVEEFEEHYKGYEDPLHPADVIVRFGAITDFEQLVPGDEALEFPMFTTTNGDKEIHPVTELDKSEYILTHEQLALLDILPNYDLQDPNPYEDNMETGYFIMELFEPRNALYNNIYQNELQKAINQNVQNPEESKKLPAPPIIPYFKNLQFSYKAESEWNITHGDSNKPEMNFHIHPYGVEMVYNQGSVYKDYMFPEYNNDGYLFIGLKEVNTPESITFFFELTSEDTTDQNIKNVPRITWMYLSENRWIPFDDNKLIFDTTYGFTESGLIQLQLPITLTNNNTILDEGLYWIGAKLSGDVTKICKAISLRTNGVVAKWVFNEEMNDRLEDEIESGRINQFLEVVPQIKDIFQPFPTFDGKEKEDIKTYNVRVSERLRHKNRIITHWDMERIALEFFPNIQQAKAISYLSDPQDKKEVKEYVFADEGENEESYGIRHQDGVKLVIIPIQAPEQKNKTPKFSLHRLLTVQKFLSVRISPFMNIQVINPKYEYIRVIANVKFIENYNNGLTLNRLIDDINNFIAPWINSEYEEVKIGGSLNENVLQNFIKGKDYVKFLTKFSLLHIVEEDGLYKLQDTAMEKDIVSIIKARPWGVLIPDDIHEIEMIEYEEEELPEPRVNSDQIIRFQNKVNILGDKKYIKVKNARFGEGDNNISKNNPTTNFTINI